MEKEKKLQRETPSYYAILPAEVRYSKDLSPMEKIMYAEINALSSKSGKCWGSNGYFAELYGVEPTTVSEWINNLFKYGFVNIVGAKSKKRVISLTNILRKKPKVISVKAEGQPSEKAEHNNTSSNSIINNNTAKAEVEIFSYKEYLDNIIHGNNRLVAIVAIFAVFKKKIFKNKKSANAFLYSGFNLKYAKDLKDFDDSEIMKAMRKCDAYIIDGRKTDWSLKAVVNAINK